MNLIQLPKKIQEAARKIMKMIPGKDASVVLAISGGVDSMSLLSLFSLLGYTNVHIAHLDHLIREDSFMDHDKIQEEAAQKGYSFCAAQYDIRKYAKEKKIGTEEAGRIVRYHFFEEVRVSVAADWVVLAHHGDDVLESQLLHILRGSGLSGLQNMKEKDFDRHLFRPFLSVTKEDILEYAKKLSVHWREDSTNEDLSIERNFLRKKILPEMLGAFPHMRSSMKRLGMIAEESVMAIFAQLEESIGKAFHKKNQWEWQKINSLSMTLRRYFFFFLLGQLGNNVSQSNAQIDTLTRNFSKLISGKKLQLAKHIFLERNFSTVSVIQEQIEEELPEPLIIRNIENLPINLMWGDRYLSLQFAEENAAGVLLPQSWLESGICIRNKLSGDKIRCIKKGELYHKNLKTYFLEKKVPLRERKSLPVLVCIHTGDILAVLGIDRKVIIPSIPLVSLTLTQ